MSKILVLMIRLTTFLMTEFKREETLLLRLWCANCLVPNEHYFQFRSEQGIKRPSLVPAVSVQNYSQFPVTYVNMFRRTSSLN